MLPAGIGVRIDRAAWQVPAIFRLIQERGHVDEMEMYRVFNMGIGMVLLVAPEQVEQAMGDLARRSRCHRAGRSLGRKCASRAAVKLFNARNARAQR